MHRYAIPVNADAAWEARKYCSSQCYRRDKVRRAASTTPWLEEDRGHDTPCWIWQLRIGTRGYGDVRRDGVQQNAHVWVYERLLGPVPPSLELDHLCRVRACVNPEHLEPVTHLENVQRGVDARTTCAKGHEYTPENTYYYEKGRKCRTCGREAAQRRRTRGN